LTDWYVALFDRFVHPVQVGIMEAFDWIAEPFSPSQFVAMWDGSPPVVSNASYHFRALERYGVLTVVEVRSVRGAGEVIYRPADGAGASS
jgi:hypothetical protein